MPRRHHLLSDEQIERFKAMYADLSLELREIGAAFGVGISSIFKWRAQLNLPRRPHSGGRNGRYCPGRRQLSAAARRRQILADAELAPEQSPPEGLGSAGLADDAELADFYDGLPPATLPARPARPRPTDRPGERWLQLI